MSRTVRVFEWPDGRLAIMNAVEGVTLDEAMQKAQAADPNGLPYGNFTDVEDTDLPPRVEVDADGDDEAVRGGWRKQGSSVVVKQDKVPPNWVGLRGRLMIEYSDDDAIVLRIGAFDGAMTTQDVQQARAIIGLMRAALEPQQRARFNQIVNTKKF